MFKSVLALVIAAHFISDFLFQTSQMAEQKCLRDKAGWLAMGGHIAIILVFNLAAFYLLLNSWCAMFGAMAVTVTHFGIDGIKSFLKNKKYFTLTFVLDQVLHIILIVGIVYFVTNHIAQTSYGYYEFIKQVLYLPDWNVTCDNVVWTISIGVGCVWGGACLIRSILCDLKLDTKSGNEKEVHSGKWIGILERISILILIPLNQWAAVGLLLTAKSIARHSKMDDKQYAEYYLIGTLLSFIAAVVCGVLIAGIWNVKTTT